MTQRKKPHFSRSLAYLTFTFLLSSQASAQIHTPQLPANSYAFLVEEQFQQGHYTAAIQSADKYLMQQQGNIYNKNIDVDKVKFYRIASALKLSTNTCVEEAKAYITATANPAGKRRMAYRLAQFYFEQGMLANAIPYYEMAGIDNLSNAEIANARFELAYCYFNSKQFDKAEPLLASIKALDGKYYNAGNYYYGLLAYNESNYAEALKSFQIIENQKEYNSIVPYYIAEIYYFMGNKGKALSDAKRLINKPEKQFYDNELHLLAAQVLFEDQKYAEALPYFEHYYQHSDKIRKEDLYEMAYCYFRGQQWDNAIDKFRQLSNTQDSLGQTSMYLLGDCYLKTGDRRSARNAFSVCADMPYNAGQREAALLLAAKLSYELGYNDEAISRVNDLLQDYPNTQYKDEAKTLMSDLLIKTNNYADAYNSLREVKTQDENYWRVLQKVTYGYALQQMQAGNNSVADELLALSLRHPADAAYEAAALFWRGDMAYKQHQYENTISYTQSFITKADGNRRIQYLSPEATMDNAYTNMGYASMALNDYKAAQTYFSKAQQAQVYDSARYVNSLLREADAVFMQKDYTRAIALYDKVIAANGADADYARFQKAVILGLAGRTNEKINILQGLINKTPASAYKYDAHYEIALAYIEADKYKDAIAMLTPLTEAFDKRDLAPKAWMKIGFAHQQAGNDDKAIEAYRHVAVEYPTSEERPATLDALKSLYIEHNQPGAYAQLLKDNNISTSGDAAVDSAYYAAAETQFGAGKWQNAKQALGQYLSQYPNGVFANKAHYYKAESHYQLKEYKEALVDYDAVLNNSWSNFSEPSAKRAAIIAFNDKDYTAALNYYGKLRNTAMGPENLQAAYNGMMQSSFNLKQYETAALYADTVLSLPGADEALINNALSHKAKSLYNQGKQEDAFNLFKQLQSSKNPAIAAEAHYYVAEAYYKQDKLKEAEAAANTTIKNAAGNEYLVVRSFILLADILVKQKDYFNAKATLQSLVKNVKIPELKQEAAGKLEEVKAMEKKQSKVSEE